MLPEFGSISEGPNTPSSSLGRRLFPQRRPSFNSTAHSDWQQSSDEDAIDSDNDTSSLCGSVKINRLSCLDWSDSGEAPKPGGQRPEARVPQRPTFQETSDEQETAQADRPRRGCSQASVLTAQQAPDSLYDAVHQVDTWDAASTVWTIATTEVYGKVRVHFAVQLTVISIPEPMMVERVSLLISLRNAISYPTIHLSPGQTTYVVVTGGVPASTCEQQDGQLTVVRHLEDLDIPLQLNFSYDYSLMDFELMVPILSLRPHMGRLRSESVYIAASYPPLTTRPLTRKQLSTWKLGPNTTKQVTHYERTPLQRLYPEGFSDDIRLRITDPYPVPFQVAGNLARSDAVWDFDLCIKRLLDVHLLCKMSLTLHVGEANRLLNVNSRGWIPIYSIIDGLLATNEWRQGNGMTLFKHPRMNNGMLKVEVIWQKFQNPSHFKIALPIVTDRRILPGRIRWKADRSKIPSANSVPINNLTTLAVLDSVGVVQQKYDFVYGPDAILPELFPGHQMYLHSFSEVAKQISLFVAHTEKTEEEIEPNSNPSKTRCWDKARQFASDVQKPVNAYQQAGAYWSLESMIYVLLVLGWTIFCNSWLIPLLNGSVERLRVDTSYSSAEDNATFIARAEPATVMATNNGGGEMETSVPALGTYSKGDTEEAPAMRDWVDCFLGWGGEVCKRD